VSGEAQKEHLGRESVIEIFPHVTERGNGRLVRFKDLVEIQLLIRLV
jgi:hypothetical protein